MPFGDDPIGDLPIGDESGGQGPIDVTLAFTEESDIVSCSVSVIVDAALDTTDVDDVVTGSVSVIVDITTSATDEDDSVSIAVDVDISAALNSTDEDDTVSVLLAQEIHEQVAQPAIGGGSMWLELAYYHKRLADEEAEKKRLRKQLREEAERIAAETALSIRARHEAEIKAEDRTTAQAIRRERAEIEALETDIERLQAEMNRTYREEITRRRAEEEQEMMDIIFAMLTEV